VIGTVAWRASCGRCATSDAIVGESGGWTRLLAAAQQAERRRESDRLHPRALVSDRGASALVARLVNDVASLEAGEPSQAE
jgi:hypothetical protein